MRKKLHLLAIFYYSFGFYLWAIPMVAWCSLGMPVGRDLGVLLPSLVFFKLFLQAITIRILRRKYSHLFYFYANASLSQPTLFVSAFATDFVLFFLSMSIIQLASEWIN